MDDSVLNNIVKFEYLSNLIKLRYLRDCFKGSINNGAISKLIVYSKKWKVLQVPSGSINNGAISKLIGSISPDEINKAKILHSKKGRAFLVYLNKPIYFGNRKGSKKIGPLIRENDLTEKREIKDLYEVNCLIKEEIRKSDRWFQIFCEYILVKISLHELIVDISDEKYGYLDLMKLIKISEMDEIKGAKLREVIIYAMRLGLDPLLRYDGYEQDISHLKDCKYTEFIFKRDQWCERANYALSLVKERMSRNYLTLVVQWDKYSMCAFDCGPVFIRKRREPLVSKLCFSFNEYSEWNENKALKDKMKEIIEKDVNILIGRYNNYFGNGNDTVEFFQENRDFVENIEKMEAELKSKWEQLKI